MSKQRTTSTSEEGEQFTTSHEDTEQDRTEDTRERSADELPVTEQRADDWSVVLAFVLAGTGLLFGSPVLVATATIPLLYAGAAGLTGVPEPAVSLNRTATLGADANATDDVLSGEPGTSVYVTLTVRNEGTQPLVDLRLADGVPEALPVVDGPARTCVTLGPGEEAILEYTVELQRGEHTFESASLQARDISGTSTVDWGQSAVGDQTLRCSPAVDQAPVGSGSNDFAGDVPTDEGGSGVEFHSVREYEPGDAVTAIDWRRYANSRELASIEYRAERSARILCVVDARQNQFHTPANSELSLVELTSDAAERVARLLLQEGHPTGVATFDTHNVSFVPPATGPEMRDQVSAVFDAVTDNEYPGGKARRLRSEPEAAVPRVTSSTTQVFLFSGFTDDKPLDLLTHLQSLGYSVCVVSPTVGSEDTDGPAPDALSVRLAELGRKNRLATARRAGATVLEWDLDDTIGAVLNRAVGEVRSP